MAKCRICGAPHTSCGPATTVIPVDTHITQGGQTVGLNRYEVTVPGRGGGHKTTLLLSDEDAKQMGVLDQKADKPARNKARKPANTSRTPRNKAAAKPAAKPAATPAASSIEDATDPGATEA